MRIRFLKDAFFKYKFQVLKIKRNEAVQKKI